MGNYHIKVKNIRGVSDLEKQFDGNLLVIAGKNASGKTSSAIAIAAAAGQTTDPIGIGKNALKHYVKSGKPDEAYSQVKFPNDSISAWDAIGQNNTTEGSVPQSSPIALGVETPIGENPEGRFRLLSSIMSLQVSEKQFVNHLGKLIAGLEGVVPDNVDLESLTMEKQVFISELWKIHETQGMDVLNEHCSEERRSYKALFRDISGQTFKQEHSKWVPSGLDEKDIRLTPEELDDQMVAIETKIEENKDKVVLTAAMKQSIEDSKIDIDAERAKLKELEELHQTFLAQMKSIRSGGNSKIDECNKKIAERKKLEAIIADGSSMAFSCPECSAYPIVVEGNKLVKAENITADDESVKDKIKAISRDISELKKEIELMRSEKRKCEEDITNSERNISEVRVTIDQHNRNMEMLSKMTEDEPTVSIDELKGKLAVLKEKYSLLVRMHRARTAHKKAMWLDCGCKTSSSDSGVKRDLISAGVKKVNTFLKVISDSGGWGEFQIDENSLIVKKDNIPAPLLSESEKWRAKALIAAAAAYKSESKLMILDGADILTSELSDGLLKIIEGLKKHGITCIVGISVSTDAPIANIDEDNIIRL